MKKAKIFLVGESEDKLMAMTETPYSTEDVLQVLLARYPDLIPGDQIDPDEPRRWLLVKREFGIPSEKDGGNIWSLDHLLLDQEGVPTFIECKRATDTRIRREVVAQMLDYAANGTEYWPVDQLRQAAAETAQRQKKSLDEEIGRLLADEAEINIEGYWQRVEENLRNGKVRLVFVTDETPRELRRLVEFLNTKMSDVEVIVVEIKQFVGHGNHKAIVPRVIGLTEKARERKTSKAHTNRQEFLAKCDPVSAKFFSHMLDLCEKRGYIIYWGEKGFSVRAQLSKSDTVYSFAYGWPSSVFQFYFGLPLPDEEAKQLRRELLAFGIFKESGKKTLNAEVSKQSEARLEKVLAFILDKMEQISKTH